MGNKNSKQQRPEGPAFKRSDTQTSTKSARSARSRRSSSHQTGGDDPRPYTPAAGSAAVTPAGAPPQPGNGGSGGEDADGYPFPQVPRSLQVHEPREPILIYRDQEGNITNPQTPALENGVSTVGTSGSDGAGANGGHGSVGSNGYGGPGSLGSNSTPRSPGGISMNLPDHHPGQLSIPGANSAATTPGGEFGPHTPSNLSFQRELPFSSSPRTPGGAHLIGGPAGEINIDETIQLLLDAGYSGKTTRTFCLKGSEIAAICKAAREIFLSQPTLLELQPPVKIVGDTHGQYGDLLRLFNMCGFPPEANYLFLGDYVDRGKQSLETIMLLLCYKIKYPCNFFILRGNHECAGITRIYGFYDECKRRASVKTWRTFIDTFNTLPIAAVVAGKIFCVHGGLSPSLTSINDIRQIERPTDVPDYGLLNDLLWSDPTDGPNEWEDNERGVSYCYNKVAIDKFVSRFGYDLVCRAHMVVEDGYEFFNDRSLVTVFSAPNYCGEFDNWGAVMSVSEDLLCSFELLKPMDSSALKEEMRREKHERRTSQQLTQSV